MQPPLLLLLLGPRAQGQVLGSGDQGLEDIKGHESASDHGQEDRPMACLGTGACYQVHYYGGCCKICWINCRYHPIILRRKCQTQ